MVGMGKMVDLIAEKTGIPKTMVKQVAEAFVLEIQTGVAKGEKFTFQGFGSFKSKTRKGGMRRNPRTGQPVAVADKTVLAFNSLTDLSAL